MSAQRNHSLFGTVKSMQKNAALASNGLRNTLPPGVPHLKLPESTPSVKTEESDQIPPRIPARYSLQLSINQMTKCKAHILGICFSKYTKLTVTCFSDLVAGHAARFVLVFSFYKVSLL